MLESLFSIQEKIMMNKVSDFSKLLDEMREHTKRSLVDAQTQPFTPSTPELQTLLATAKENSNRINFSSVDDIIGQLKNAAKQDSLTAASDVREKINKATQTYQQDSNTDEFRGNMERAIDYTKQDISEQINRLYDQATNLVQQHPEAGEAIVQFMDSIPGFFQALFSKIKDFIINAIQNPVTWIRQAAQEINNFFSDLNSWISQTI
jgi:ABC-type transporter Mla subunit MlaD